MQLLGRQLEGEADERDPAEESGPPAVEAEDPGRGVGGVNPEEESGPPAVEADDPGRGVDGVNPAGERSAVVPEGKGQGLRMCARGWLYQGVKEREPRARRVDRNNDHKGMMIMRNVRARVRFGRRGKL